MIQGLFRWDRSPWDALLEEARDGALLTHKPMHGERHWRGVAWAGLRIAELRGHLRDEIMVVFGLLHDCRREMDDWDPEHGDRAARVAAQSRPLKRILGAEGRDLVAEACRLHERGLTRPESLTIGACWDADRVNLVRLGFRLDPRYFTVLSREDGSLERIAEETRQVFAAPPSWMDLFAAADTMKKTV